MRLAVIGAVTFVALLSVTGCKKKGGLFCYKSNGDIKTEVRVHEGFDEVSLSTSADVKIIQGENYSVEVIASENILPIIKTKVSGSTLKIDLKNNTCLKSKDDIKVNVIMPELKGLNISGSGEIRMPNKMTTNDLDVKISGSGDIVADSLFNNDLSVNISGSGDLFLESLDTSHSNDIRISGSGKLNLFGMPVLKSTVNISGSGQCDLNVVESLDVKISGSGDLRYIGNPSVYQTISGSGSVRPY